MTAGILETGHLLTPAEVAALLKTDRSTVSALAGTGKLAFVRTPGGNRRYTSAAADGIFPDRRQPTGGSGP